MEGLLGTQILVHETSIVKESQQDDQGIPSFQGAASLQVGAQKLDS